MSPVSAELPPLWSFPRREQLSFFYRKNPEKTSMNNTRIITTAMRTQRSWKPGVGSGGFSMRGVARCSSWDMYGAGIGPSPPISLTHVCYGNPPLWSFPRGFKLKGISSHFFSCLYLSGYIVLPEWDFGKGAEWEGVVAPRKPLPTISLEVCLQYSFQWSKTLKQPRIVPGLLAM